MYNKSLLHTCDDQKRLRYLNPMQVNKLELDPVINEKSEMFKGMSNKKMPAAIKKAQQKLNKEKRDLSSTHIGQLMQRLEKTENVSWPPITSSKFVL
jgi:hypothetical protein